MCTKAEVSKDFTNMRNGVLYAMLTLMAHVSQLYYVQLLLIILLTSKACENLFNHVSGNNGGLTRGINHWV